MKFLVLGIITLCKYFEYNTPSPIPNTSRRASHHICQATSDMEIDMEIGFMEN